jgi:lysophospholipase L1-like esterase
MLDHMHYNNAGRDLLAERIADIINNRLGVVNSSPTE